MKRLLLFLLAIPLIVFAQDPIIIHPPELSREFHGIRPVTATSRHRPKIGIVLSGGGARGIAQIGVLRALEKHHIPIDLIVGNSMGSVVGGLYASGYTTAQIESITVHANWDEVLSFTESTRRTDLFIGQKQSEQAGYLVVRFDGLEPIIPSSISGGQRLFNFFTNLTLQALYHPNPSFDDLKIPFRAVATDLLSGKRVIFEQGSLGEALRASVTVPLLYAPLERDSMRLVDGGLVSNMPVDIADSLGCDLVIVVNSTSGMRREDQLGAPWQIADQIMTIMMAESNRRQMEKADIVITPDVGDRIVSDFSGIEELVARGERAAEESLPQLQRLLHMKSTAPEPGDTAKFFHPEISFAGDSIPDNIHSDIVRDTQSESVSYAQIEEQLVRLSTTGMFRDVYAEITNHVTPPKIVYHTTYNSRIAQVHFTGNNVVSDQMIFAEVSPLVGKIISYPQLQNSLEKVLKLYRDREYSLARIESVKVDSVTNTLSFVINEGIIQDIRFEGNRRTKDYVLRRELPLTWGDVFKLDKMYQGLINLTSLGLFEYVLLDIRYEQNRPVLVVKVNEKSSELLRFGLHTDNERGVVSTFDIRDANFRGAGEDLALTFRFGLRDRLVRAEYRANRIFRTYLTFNLRTYFTSRDVFTYRDESTGSTALWDRIEDGQYKETKYGGSFTFGSQLERFGNVTAEIRAEHHRIAAITGLGYAPEDYRYVGIKLQTTVDTENKFAFPTEGMMLNLSYESALKGLGSERSFSKIGFTYENYWTFLLRNTVRSRISVGFADKTLPTTEQYSFGGLNSFFGVREDDSRGRQIFLINLEYRYWLPFKLIFESFLKTRYDLGTISTVPEDLKFNRFRHGIGLEIGLDTPLGPAAIGAGKSFYFRQDLPGSPVSLGPLLFYFSFGPSL